jgi:predicted transcriptional regulator
VKSLGELERAVMDVLWARAAPTTVREVATDLAARNLAHTTVMTVLDRLARKQFVRRERDADGRTWRYVPAAGRDAYIAKLMLQALDLTGDRPAALVHFARSVPQPDAEVLRTALTADFPGGSP